MTTGAVQQGRAAFAGRAWSAAYAALTAADADSPLEPADLERLAVAAYLVGSEQEAAATWERAHRELLAAGDAAGAVRCAFWLGLVLLLRGEAARGGGWLGRAQELVDTLPGDGMEHALLLATAALGALRAGDAAAARTAFAEVTAAGRRHGSGDLVAFGLLGEGQAHLAQGEIADGLAVLDRALVALTVDEVSPIAAGFVYCAVIIECRQAFQLDRAREWTAALTEWCRPQPDLVPFRGQCLVHRSELLQLHGEWSGAMDEVRRACVRLSDPPDQPAAGMAHYQQAELHRLRGEFDEAERAYAEARRHGREPQPGLALLRLGQGRREAALAGIRRMLEEAEDRGMRARALAAAVEIMLAGGDAAAARSAVTELGELAAALAAPFLDATVAYATGAVALAEGDATGALRALRRACTSFHELEVPYEAAQARVLLAEAYRLLGDAEGASFEIAAARQVFERLGARPALARLDEERSPARAAAGPLTERELEVLALAAAGRTNREIGRALGVSEHTVRRHLQNVFAKLGVPSRAAASAWALRHGLI